MAAILDFNAARAARGLAVLAPPDCLDRRTAAALRRWRCFEARMSQREAAELAGVTPREWQRLETGRTVARQSMNRALDWARGGAPNASA